MRQRLQESSCETVDSRQVRGPAPDLDASFHFETPPLTEEIPTNRAKEDLCTTGNGVPIHLPTVRRALEAMSRSVRTFRTELRRLQERDRTQTETIREMRRQLQLAGAVQRNFLPTHLPEPHGVDVQLFYHPAGSLSGDSYDAYRMDESRVAFVLADATGHGLPSAMLSAYVQRSFRGMGKSGPDRRRLEPNDVLAAANRDLLDTELVDCQFVAAVCVVYDEERQTVRWARGGTPYPILIRKGQPPRQIESEGPIVGVCENARFEPVELSLDPGDLLLFHTDGLDELLMRHENRTDPSPSGHRQLSHTDWFRTLGQGAVTDHLREIERRVVAAEGAGLDVDDVTILTLQVRDRITEHVNGKRRSDPSGPAACGGFSSNDLGSLLEVPAFSGSVSPCG